MDCQSRGRWFKALPEQNLVWDLWSIWASSTTMSMLTVLCQWEDDTVRERTVNLPRYSKAKKMKPLTRASIFNMVKMAIPVCGLLCAFDVYISWNDSFSWLKLCIIGKIAFSFHLRWINVYLIDLQDRKYKRKDVLKQWALLISCGVLLLLASASEVWSPKNLLLGPTVFRGKIWQIPWRIW